MGGLTRAILTPPAGRGAIGVVQVRADDAASMDDFFKRAELGTVLRAGVGVPVLTDLLGVDRGLAVRWDERTVDLFPHGGPAVVRGVVRALEGLGAASADSVVYPEAADGIEAAMLEVLSRAASPLAVDLLLDQPRRWRQTAAMPSQGDSDEPDARARDTDGVPPPLALRARRADVADGRVLRRLIDPPLVVAVGPPNIGKSTLLNRLAGRSVSIVADEPGTTRDHVGASLVLDGLAVRYLDTPGLLEGAAGVDREVIELAAGVAATADLVLACGDPGHEPPLVEGESLRVCLRRDLGQPVWRADVEVCARDGLGVDALVAAVRERLVPDRVLRDPRPWRFWDVSGVAPR